MQVSTMLEMPNFSIHKLEPGQSLIQYYDSVPAPGNYTIASFARFLGDINGTCSMVYLWSQPIDLTVLPEEKVPEFPFAVIVLIIATFAIVMISRIKRYSI